MPTPGHIRADRRPRSVISRKWFPRTCVRRVHGAVRVTTRANGPELLRGASGHALIGADLGQPARSPARSSAPPLAGATDLSLLTGKASDFEEPDAWGANPYSLRKRGRLVNSGPLSPPTLKPRTGRDIRGTLLPDRTRSSWRRVEQRLRGRPTVAADGFWISGPQRRDSRRTGPTAIRQHISVEPSVSDRC